MVKEKEMIEKLQIRGFGANEKLDVEFSPNVTSIVGKSFIGKSWMLRALRWDMLNKPAGDSFINWDSDEAKVRLSIDGKKVTRIRNNSDNSYRLSGKAKPYVAFGSDVPRDIAELVNVSDRVNFQGQHSTKENRIPFWFCETAGEVSRQLNSIVNLEVIDNTLANIASEHRKAKVVIEVTEKALEEAIRERKELAHVEDLNIELERVESLKNEHEANAEKRSRIDSKLDLVAKYAYIREKRLGLVSDGLLVLSVGEKHSEIAASVEKLSKSVESAQDLQDALKNSPPSIGPLKKLKTKAEQSTAQFDRLDDLIESIESGRQEKCKVEKELERHRRMLEEIAEGRCPLCGAKAKS